MMGWKCINMLRINHYPILMFCASCLACHKQFFKGSVEGSFKCHAHEFRVYILGTGEPVKASEQNGLINTVCGDKYIVHL